MSWYGRKEKQELGVESQVFSRYVPWRELWVRYKGFTMVSDEGRLHQISGKVLMANVLVATMVRAREPPNRL